MFHKLKVSYLFLSDGFCWNGKLCLVQNKNRYINFTEMVFTGRSNFITPEATKRDKCIIMLEQLKTYDLRKLGNIRKVSKLCRIIA